MLELLMLSGLVHYVALAIIVGIWAHYHRGRRGLDWGTLALVTSPLLVWLLLLALPDRSSEAYWLRTAVDGKDVTVAAEEEPKKPLAVREGVKMAGLLVAFFCVATAVLVVGAAITAILS
jgi:hypothetical protein